MNTITRPIYYLMNQLSYRSKFVLLASLFAVPLVFFAGQLAYTFHQAANQVKHTQTGLNYLKQATNLIEDLETLRDLAVIVSAQRESMQASKIENAKQKVLKRITQLQTLEIPKNHLKYLSELKIEIQEKGLIRGNEAGIEGVYEQAHSLINQTYAWRTKLSYSFISRTRNSANIVDTLNLLNESEAYLHALGQTRAFGSLYLEQTFIDSYGSSVLEKTYLTLSKLIEMVDVKAEEYQDLIKLYPQVQAKEVKQNLNSALERFYQALIVNYTPSDDPEAFYSDITKAYKETYQHNHLLFKLLDNVLEQEYQKSKHRLSVFYISVGLMILLISYIYLGLYTSMNSAVRSLMKSARKVAAADYKDPIKTHTKDELSSIAAAMDAMRLSIQEREEKLAFMGQRDGLTKLYNRQYFDTALDLSLANSLRQHTPFTLVMIDIAHFKSINDNYGHQTGDECLRHAARLIQEQYQRKTDIVARYGGEEFIAILYGSTLEEAAEQTEALRSTIESHKVESGDKTIQFTASFGLAALAAHETSTSSDLIALADSLLYQSKHTGRNRLSAAYYSKDSYKPH